MIHDSKINTKLNNDMNWYEMALFRYLYTLILYLMWIFAGSSDIRKALYILYIVYLYSLQEHDDPYKSD